MSQIDRYLWLIDWNSISGEMNVDAVKEAEVSMMVICVNCKNEGESLLQI